MEIREPDRKLINEGAVQYFDALRALREFRAVILGLCANVVQRRGESLAKAMGTRVEINSAKDEVFPDTYEDLLQQAHWPRAWVGRRLDFPEFGNAYWGIECGSDRVGASEAIIVSTVVGYTIRTNAIRDRALLRFREAGVATIEKGMDRGEVHVRTRLRTGEIHGFSEVLEQSTDEWIKIWQYVGGLPGIAEGTEPHNG
jgi:hypothetical protein